MNDREIITRAEAKARGLKRYFTGNPCTHGHVAERQTYNSACGDCVEERNARLRRPEKAYSDPIANETGYMLAPNQEVLLRRFARAKGRLAVVDVLHACGVRYCRRCDTLKPVSEYHKQGSERNGLQMYCVTCCRKIQKRGREVNRAARNKSLRKKRRDDPKPSLLNSARHRAKKQGVPFTITVDDFEIPQCCPLLGIPLIASKGKVSKNSPTLDKIIPERGYVSGNVIVISHLANAMKQNASAWELWQFARNVMDLFETRTSS